MTLRQRWGTAFAVGLLLFVILALVLATRIIAVNRTTDKVADIYQPASVQVSVLETAMSDMLRGLEAFLLTGDESSLRPYADGSRQSSLALAQLKTLLADEPAFTLIVNTIESDRDAWVASVAQPVISAKRAGEGDEVIEVVRDSVAVELYQRLQTNSEALRAMVDQRRSEGFDELLVLNRTLAGAFGAAMLILLAGFLMIGVLLGRWVVLPLDRLRVQLRSVASGHEKRPIEPSGPPDLLRVGQDAESMRRQLVAEIDAARSARAALQQRAPVVSAIRDELAAGPPRATPGLRLAGEVSPAEGVLAGDWWDAVLLPTGELVIMLADVSGHGAAAGVAAMRLKHTVTNELVTGKQVSEAMAAGAAVLAGDEGRFATMVLITVDPDSGRLRWANAGHHPAVVLSPAGVREDCEGTGPILSWLGGSWHIGESRLARDETLLLFSDGLIESHDAQGEELGIAGLMDVLRSGARASASVSETVAWLLARARVRSVDWERDDVTLVAVQRDPAAE